MLGPSDARVLDLTGPWEVFSRVNEVLAERRPDDKAGYQLELATTGAPRSIDCFGGLKIQARNFKSLDPQPVFVRDGKFFTSAGVSVSIDLSLAMAEEDYGHAVAAEVAKPLLRLFKLMSRPPARRQVQ